MLHFKSTSTGHNSTSQRVTENRAALNAELHSSRFILVPNARLVSNIVPLLSNERPNGDQTTSSKHNDNGFAQCNETVITDIKKAEQEEQPAAIEHSQSTLPLNCRAKKVQRVTLIVFALFVLITLIGLIFFVHRGGLFSSSKSQGNEICNSAMCKEVAGYILNGMNSSVDPCVDFYEFACGTWLKNNPLTDDEQAVNLFQHLTESVDNKLKNALSTKPASTDLPIIVHTKHFYASCLNETMIDSREWSPFSQALSQYGWWSSVDAIVHNLSTSNQPGAIEDLLADIRLYGTRALFDVWVGPDDKNSTIYSIYLDQGDLSLTSRDYYVQPTHAAVLSHYRTTISETIMALSSLRSYNGTTIQSTMTKQQSMLVADTILNLEVQIANMTTTAEERRQGLKQYNNFTIATLLKLYPDFDWHRYVKRVFSSVGIRITENDTIVVSGVSYIQKVMQHYNSLQSHVLAAYAIWKYVFHRLPYLGKKQRSVTTEISKLLRGTAVEKGRWQTCLQHLNTMTPHIVARMFLEATRFDSVQRAEATRMIGDVKEAFIEALNVTEWMEEETRQSAVRKAKAMEDLIGFPDYLLNDAYINALYANVSLNQSTFFENYVQLERFKTMLMLRNLHTLVDRFVWTSSPASINAYHSSNRNQITLPAGILHPPFYHVDYPKAVNYGIIGMIIGHEITHGFDDKGRQYDSQGNLRNWWSDRDASRFKEKAQCIIDQYSNYFIPEANMFIRGTATQGENIADNGGLKYAFRAYKKWVTEFGEEKRLPGLSLTNDQVFFVSFGQIWCESRRKESTASRLISVKHSPQKYRVIGTLSNLPEFSQTFACSPNSPMNPAHKCTVW